MTAESSRPGKGFTGFRNPQMSFSLTSRTSRPMLLALLAMDRLARCTRLRERSIKIWAGVCHATDRRESASIATYATGESYLRTGRADNLNGKELMKRREFIILTGAGAETITLLSACGHPENKLIPVFIPDDDYVPGLDYWKATSCSMCSAGCGILVRTREHKANKIEGNPVHPVNRGALCARGQAGIQVHYNPDRIRGPKKRTG